MADIIRFKRGTHDRIKDYTPGQGEPIYDKTRKSLRIGNGSDPVSDLPEIKGILENPADTDVLDAGVIGWDKTRNILKFGDGTTNWEQLIALKATPEGFGNVLDYGADPTGTNDSTVAFQKAIAENERIWVPYGTYTLNDDLDITNLRILAGNEANITVNGQMYTSGRKYQLKIYGVTIEANQTIDLSRTTEVFVKDTIIKGTATPLLKFAGEAWSLFFIQSRIIDSTLGIQIDTHPDASTNAVNNLSFIDCILTSGIKINEPATHIIFTNTALELINGANIELNDKVQNLSFLGSRVEINNSNLVSVNDRATIFFNNNYIRANYKTIVDAPSAEVNIYMSTTHVRQIDTDPENSGVYLLNAPNGYVYLSANVFMSSSDVELVDQLNFINSSVKFASARYSTSQWRFTGTLRLQLDQLRLGVTSSGNSMPTTVDYKYPVYDYSGNLLGYIPIVNGI